MWKIFHFIQFVCTHSLGLQLIFAFVYMWLVNIFREFHFAVYSICLFSQVAHIFASNDNKHFCMEISINSVPISIEIRFCSYAVEIYQMN